MGDAYLLGGQVCLLYKGKTQRSHSWGSPHLYLHRLTLNDQIGRGSVGDWHTLGVNQAPIQRGAGPQRLQFWGFSTYAYSL